MLTSKERAELKGIAQTIDAILQVGKSGIGEPLVKQVDDALQAREMIKLSVLETAPEEPKETAAALAAETRSEVVQVIGRKIVLYRRRREDPLLLTGKKPAEKEKSRGPKPRQRT